MSTVTETAEDTEVASGLVYIGKVLEIKPIENADRIESANVDCGDGGLWWGVVGKEQFCEGDLCVVYLQDSIIPPCEELAFMAKSNWRVRMQRLRGALSECVIMPCQQKYIDTLSGTLGNHIGRDITQMAGVARYAKKVPNNMGGESRGTFPHFIPKTDEPNFQKCGRMLSALHGQPFYVTAKCDGMSATAYKHDGHFGVCSRNQELVEHAGNALWQLAYRYDLPKNLPDDIALQWETVGPGIQKNPMGLCGVQAFAFSAWNILERRYLGYADLVTLCDHLGFPMVPIVGIGTAFDLDAEQLRQLADGTYDSGKPREGIVVRPMEEMDVCGSRLSFKVLNLNYKD